MTRAIGLSTNLRPNPSFPDRIARAFIGLTLAAAPAHRAVAQSAADTSDMSPAVAFAERCGRPALHFTARRRAEFARRQGGLHRLRLERAHEAV